MPSQSKAQQKFMGMVHALKKGDIEPSSVSKDVRDAADSMSKKDAKDFASTPHKGLPKKVKQEILNKLKEYANKMGRDHLGGDDYTSKRKGGLRDFDGYDNVDYNKDMPMDEAKRSVVHKAVKKGSFPVTLVVVKNGKVVDQELVKTPEAVPASFNVIQSKHKGATIHIEDRTGKRLFSESVNEGPIDRVVGGRPYKYVGDGRRGKAIVSGPLKDRERKDIIKRAQKAGYSASPGIKGGVIIQVESVNEGVNEFFYMEFKKWAYQHRAKINRLDKEDKIELLSKAYLKKYGKYHRGEHPDYIGAELLHLLAKDRILKESKGVPQNYMQGRTSDYHTALRGKNKDYSGGTNFKKTNHGQPDVEEDDEDQETNQLSNKQIALKKEDMSSLSSSEKIELYKLYSKAMKAMPGSPNQKKIKILINKLRKKADLKPLPEYGQRLDLSFIEDEEARLDGTPKPKDAINRDLDEGTMIRLAGQIAQELLPKDTWSRYSSDGKKNKEFVKSVVKDLAQTLNRFYKSHNISVRIKENNIELNEIGVFDIKSYVKGIIPSSFFNTTTRDKKEKLKSTLRDLKSTLNHFWKQHDIPYRIK